jgi:hypothetical protein
MEEAGRARTSPLRSAWHLEVDPDDEYGTGAHAGERAALPASLCRALDGARERIPLPRRPEDPLRAAMLEVGEASLDEPLPFPVLSDYARYWRDGVRTAYEDQVRRLGTLTGDAVLAALATGQTRWIDRAADGLMLLCELSTWCWVAHEQSHDQRGWVVPDLGSPVLDLGAAQTLHVIAWADLALAEELDERVPGLRQRLRHEARRRVFDPYLARRDWHWLHGEAHNWTGWIHQHLIAGALFLLDEEPLRDQRDRILTLSLAQLDRYLASFPADGGIDEGFSYFWNGASRLLEALDLLITASGGALDRDAIEDIDVIGQLLRFPQRMELGDGWFVNVADGPARPGPAQPWDVLHRWGRHLGADDVVQQALAHRGAGQVPPIQPELGLGRVLTALADQEWGSADGVGVRPPLPETTWLPDVQLLVARERAADTAGLALAVKGGHNDEAHNHLDVGSYLVAADGSPVLIDLGQPTYNALTFTDRRYEIWTMTSSWHNLPEIRGTEQGVGAEFRAGGPLEGTAPMAAPGSGDGESAAHGQGHRLGHGDGSSALELELAAAYPPEAGVLSFRRRAVLDRTGADGAAVRIEDSWILRPSRTPHAGAGVVANHVIAGAIIDHRAGRLAVRALSGAVVELSWDPTLGTGLLEKRMIEDPLLAASWGEMVHRLRLPGPASRNLVLTVEISRKQPALDR